MKKCSKCGKIKPLNEFSNDKRSKDGKQCQCKACNKKYYNEHKEFILKNKLQYYIDNKEQILINKAQYYINNKEYWKNYYEKNKEYIINYNKQYYSNNKKQITIYNDEYRKNHKLYYKEYIKQYNQTAQGKLVQINYQHRRRMQIKTTPKQYRIKLREWKHILYIQNNKCNYCGREFNNSLIATVDHIIPLSKGGLHIYDNIQALCQSCNSKKNNKLNYEP